MGESTSGIVRTRSEQLETVSGVKSLSRTASAEAITIQEINSSSGQSLSGKQGFGKKPTGTSPGRKGTNHHTRKSRGSQKLELEEFNSGAALSRASSASLGFSFSFTGFTAPPEDIKDDPGHFSDEEIGMQM